jgi:hypothetical protein
VLIAGPSVRLEVFVRPGANLAFPLNDQLQRIQDVDNMDAVGLLIQRHFKESFGLASLLPDLRQKATEARIKPVLAALDQTFKHLFDAHFDLLHDLRLLEIKMPEELVLPMSFGASRHFEMLLEKGLAQGNLRSARHLMEMLDALGVPIESERSCALVNAQLKDRLSHLIRYPASESIRTLILLLESVRDLPLQIDETDLQNQVAEFLDPVLENLHADGDKQASQRWLELAGHLNLNVEHKTP